MALGRATQKARVQRLRMTVPPTQALLLPAWRGYTMAKNRSPAMAVRKPILAVTDNTVIQEFKSCK